MNVRRVFAVAALAAIATAVPTAASATYPDPDAAGTCAESQTVPEGTVLCTITAEGATDGYITATTVGPDPSTSIAGTVTSATQSLASGSADWNVTAPDAEGNIAVDFIVSYDGGTTFESVDTATIAVVEELSSTGFENMGLAVGAGALLVVGSVAVGFAARRRSQQDERVPQDA